MKSKMLNAILAVSAVVVGVLALPAAAFINWGLGLFMLAVPVYLVYMARE